MDWLQFEKDVVALFRSFGYDAVHDTKVYGGQTDILITSPHRNRANLLVECKYHTSHRDKVGIRDVEHFSARITTARMTGKIDQGYLVTNTGFTSDARAHLQNQPQEHYVFLVTYEELLQSLLDTSTYLAEFVRDYEERNILEKFIELSVIDVTHFGGAVFERGPYDLLKFPGEGGQKDDNRMLFSIVLLEDSIQKLLSNDFIYKTDNPSTLMISMDKLREESKRIRRSNDFYEKQVNYEEKLNVALGSVSSDMADELAPRLGFASSADFQKALKKDPDIMFKMIVDMPYQDCLEEESFFPRRKRWRRDFNRKLINEYMRLCRSHVRSAIDAGLLGDLAPFLINLISMEGTIRVNKLISADTPDIQVLAFNTAVKDLENFVNHNDHNLYVLLGDYGAGKTTVINRLMYALSKKKLESPYDSSVRIPLLINLRDYNKVPDFSQLIRSFIVDQAEMGNISLRLFKRMNDSGRFVLLLDGFDEMLGRVTKPDRRRCFLEIAEFIGAESKVIITGRPAYFPDHKEFVGVIDEMEQHVYKERQVDSIKPQVSCLQLMDEGQVEKFMFNMNSKEAHNILELMQKQSGLMDLARRPVLSAMIAETAVQLQEMNSGQITPRKLYQVYTDRWVQLEEDKGSFRILINPQKKSLFVRYLAMQMHLSGQLSIHYKELNKIIASQFHLNSDEEIDHFSHDVRTCSFLNRTDYGEYGFIHKSFMEFFVACEYERLDDSPFSETFKRRLTPEMINFLDFTKLPFKFSYFKLVPVFNKFIGISKEEKELEIQKQDYAVASQWRDVERLLRGVYEYLEKNIFSSMKQSSVDEKIPNLNEEILKFIEIKERESFKNFMKNFSNEIGILEQTLASSGTTYMAGDVTHKKV